MEQKEIDKKFNEAVTFFKTKKYDKALPLFEDLAKLDHAGAKYYLISHPFWNWASKIDIKTRLIWLQKAADEGITDAEYDLGACYMLGETIKADYEKAAAYFLRAAEKGNVKAQADLAFCYSKGGGVPLDYTKASYWYGKAAEQGDSFSQDMLDKLKSEGKI